MRNWLVAQESSLWLPNLKSISKLLTWPENPKITSSSDTDWQQKYKLIQASISATNPKYPWDGTPDYSLSPVCNSFSLFAMLLGWCERARGFSPHLGPPGDTATSLVSQAPPLGVNANWLGWLYSWHFFLDWRVHIHLHRPHNSGSSRTENRAASVCLGRRSFRREGKQGPRAGKGHCPGFSSYWTVLSHTFILFHW